LTTEQLRQQQRRRAQRAAMWLMLVALGIYVGFIVMSVHRSRG